MCYLCTEYEKGKLTDKEAMKALGEMLVTEEDQDKKEHLFEVANKILDKENPFKEWEDYEETGVLDELDFIFGRG